MNHNQITAGQAEKREAEITSRASRLDSEIAALDGSLNQLRDRLESVLQRRPPTQQTGKADVSEPSTTKLGEILLNLLENVRGIRRGVEDINERVEL